MWNVSAGRILLFIAILLIDIQWKSRHQTAEAQVVQFQRVHVTTGSNEYILERGTTAYTILAVTGVTMAGGTSVSGENLWELGVFLTTGTVTSPNLSPSTIITATSVTNFDDDVDLQAGRLLSFTNIMANFDLTGITCGRAMLICATIRKGSSSDPFTVSPGTGCHTVRCRGVVIESVIPSIENRADLKQGAESSDNNLQISIRLNPSPGFQSVQGMMLTQTAVFASSMADGTGVQFPAVVDTSQNQVDFGISNVNPSILQISASLSLVNVGCNQLAGSGSLTYVCVDVSRGSSPSTDYTLTFDPPEASVACRELTCLGLNVVRGTFMGNVLGEYKRSHPLTLSSVTFNSSSGGSVVGNGPLWALEVAIAQNSDGTSVYEASRTMARIAAGQEYRAFTENSMLTFTDVAVTLDLSPYECREMGSVVVRLIPHPDAVVDFTFINGGEFFDTSVAVGNLDNQILCRGVRIINVDVQPSMASADNGFPLQEFTTQMFVFDATFVTDPRFGSVVGSGLWEMSVVISSVPSPNFGTLARAGALLTAAQRNMDVQGGESLTFANTLTASLDHDDNCNGDKYFCVMISKRPGRTVEEGMEFDLDGQSVGCVLIECVGIEITGIGLAALNPTAVIQHDSPTFSMSVTVSTNPDAGSSPAMRAMVTLWSMRVVMSPTDLLDLTDLSSLPVVGDVNGNPVEQQAFGAGFTGTFGLTQTLVLDARCEDMRYLCLVIQQDRSAVSLFTYIPEDNVQYGCTRIISCQAAAISSLQVQVSPSNQVVTENAQIGQMLLLGFQAIAADISSTMIDTGSNYWQLVGFGSQSSTGEGDRVDPQPIGLTAQQASHPLMITGTRSRNFGQVRYSVLTNMADCSRLGYICLELSKNTGNPGPSPDFTLVSNAVGCVAVPCRGVIIQETTVVVTSGGLREGASLIELVVDVRMTATADSAGVTGSDLWNLFMFTNNLPDGSGNRITFQQNLVQASPWKDADVSGLVADLTGVDIGQIFDLTDTACAEVPYVCLRVSKGGTASPSFTLFPPNGASLTGCAAVTCDGFIIDPVDVNIETPPGVVIEHSTSLSSITFDAQFLAHADNENIPGGENWQLAVFLNDQLDGSGNKQMTEVVITDLNGEQNEGLQPGQQLDFQDIIARLSVDNYVCPAQSYFCVQLQKNPDRSFTLSVTEPICTAIACRGVLIDSVSIIQTNGAPFVEAAGQHSVGLRVTINTDGGYAGVGGERLWIYEVFLSSTDENSLQRPGEVSSATYTRAREEVFAGQPFVSTVDATLDLSDVLCIDADYICLIVNQGDSPSIDYTFEQGNEDNLRACIPITCQGVDLTELNLEIINGSPFLEQRAEQPLLVSFNLRFGPQTASIAGDGLWNVEIFTSSEDPPTRTSSRRDDIEFAAMDGNVVRGQQTLLAPSAFDFDFSDSICSEIRYLCAIVSKSSSANPEFTLNPLVGVQQCIEVPCRGAVLENLVIERVNGDSPILEVLANQILFSASLTANAGNAGISDLNGLDIWRFTLFTNDNPDGSGRREKESYFETSGPISQGITGTFELEFHLDLFNFICNPGPDYLCIEVGAGSQLTEGLTVTYPSPQCVEVACAGVQFGDLSVSVGSAFFLEYAPSHTVTFDLSAVTVSGKTTVETRGNAEGLEANNLWLVSLTGDNSGQSVFHQPGNIFFNRANAALTPQQAIAPYRSRVVASTFVIDDVEAQFNLSTFYCSQGDYYICVTLDKNPLSVPDFTLENSVPIQDCVVIDCRGVIIEGTAVTVTSDQFIREREFAQEVTFDLRLTSSPDGSSAMGDPLWRVVTFINTMADGSGDDLGSRAVAQLDALDQGAELLAGEEVLFDDVVTSINLQRLSSCEQTLYFCAELQKHPNPGRPFKLEGELLGCAEIDCRGVVVVSRSARVGFASSVLKEGSGSSEISIDVTYTAAASGASVEGLNLWQIQVFANSDPDGQGTRYGTIVGGLPLNGMNFALRAGEMVSFSPVSATLDFASITQQYRTCREIQYVCGRLQRFQQSPVVFSLEAEPVVATTACARFECSGVIVESTALDVTSDLEIVEDSSSFQVQFGVTLNIHSRSSNLPTIGTNHWRVVVFGNANANGLGARTNEVVVDVPANLGRSGVTQSLPTGLPGLSATLDLSGQYCNTLAFICAEVSVSQEPESVPLFRMDGFLNEPERLIGCQPTSCTGVRVIGGTLTIPSTTRLIAGLRSHRITGFGVVYSSSNTGASIAANGEALWTITVFLATNARGENPSSIVTAEIDRGLSDQSLVRGGVLNFATIAATLDTRSLRCSEAPFICTTLGKNPSRLFSLNGYSDITTEFDDSLLTVCEMITCDGVVINENEVTIVTPTAPIFAREDVSFCFNLDYTFADDGGSVTGTNLLQLEAYVQNEDGETIADSSQIVQLDGSNLTTLAGGASHALRNLKVDLNTRNLNCPNGVGNFCVRTQPGRMSDPSYTLSGNLIGCAAIECEGIRIEASTVTFLTPDAVKENEVDGRITFDLTLTVAADSAEFRLPQRLWQQVRVFTATANRVPVGNVDTVATLTFEQASTELVRGQVAVLRMLLANNFDTSDTVCRDIPYFCVTLENDPQYSVTFMDGSETTCAELPCRGVEILGVTLLNEGLRIIERDVFQTYVLDVEVRSDPNGASISGNNLWRFEAFVDTQEDCRGNAYPETRTENFDIGSRDLFAGATLDLTGSIFNMFLSSVVCPAAGSLYLCVEFNKHPSSSPDFGLNFLPNDDVRFSSVSLSCRGVEISFSNVAFPGETFIVQEGEASHSFLLNFFANVGSPDSAIVSGTNLWELEIFGSRDQSGLTNREFLQTVPITDPFFRDQPILNSASALLTFPSQAVNVDLRGIRCANFQYVCVRINRDPGSEPVFTLRGVNGLASRTACLPIACAGVMIDVFLAGIAQGTVVFENEMDQEVTTSLNIQSNPDSDNIIGNNYWRAFVFFNDRLDGFGPAGRIEETEMFIPTDQRSQDLLAGEFISFNPADATVNFNTSCTIGEYMCFEIFNGQDLRSPRVTLLENVVHCFDVDCIGLFISNTALQIQAGIEFTEGNTAHGISYTVIVESSPSGADATLDPDWRIRAFLSTRDNSGGLVNQTILDGSIIEDVLTETQQRLPFSAGTQLTFGNIQSDFSVDGLLCASTRYLCVEFYAAEGGSHSVEPLNGERERLIDCQELACVGLRVTSTNVELVSGEPLISNQVNHELVLNFDFESSLDSITLSGQRLFRLSVFPNDAPDGQGTTPRDTRAVIELNQLISSTPGTRTFFRALRPIISLQGIQCHEMPYICATLERGANPNPPYTLQPPAGDPVLTACTLMLDCAGVEIEQYNVEVQNGLPIPEDADNHIITSQITVSSSPAGGSVMGTNLWAINVYMSSSPNGQGDRFFATTAGIGFGTNEPLSAGETIVISSSALLSLNGFSCAVTEYLCHEFTKGVNPNPDFSLTAAQSLPNGLINCQQFVCDAVEFLSVNFAIDENQALGDQVPFRVHEYSPSFEVSLDIQVMVSIDSVSVSGTDLWSVTVFYSTAEDGSTPRLGETMATLTEAQGEVPIIRGQISQLDNVLATSDLRNLQCEQLQYVCIEVWKGPNSVPQYGIDMPLSQADLRQCRPVDCIGVVVLSVTPALPEESPVLIDRSPVGQTVTFDLSISASQFGAGVQGSDLWEVEAYLAADDSVGSNDHDRLAVVTATLPGTEADKPLATTETLLLEGVRAIFGLIDTDCDDILFLCATLRKSQLAVPNFDLRGNTVPSLTGCVSVECADAGVINTDMQHGPLSILEGDPAHTILMDIDVETSQFGSGIFANPLWEFSVTVIHTNPDIDTPSVSIRETLTNAQRNVDFIPGSTLAFRDVEATLNLQDLSCGDLESFCVTVGFQQPLFELIGIPDETSLQACSPVVGCGDAELNLQVDGFDEETIRISWSGGIGDFDRYQITYSPEDGSTQSPLIITRASQLNTLVFQQLTPGRLYTISLQLRAGSFSKDQPITVMQRTRPEKVTGLRVEDVDPQSIRVSWDAAGGVFDSYQISLDPSDGAPASPVPLDRIASDRTLTFRELVIGTQYEVTAVTRSGNQDSLDSRVNGFTTPTPPTLRVGESTTTEIQISWIPPAGYSPDRYIISYNATRNDRVVVTWNNVTVRRTTLENLIPGTRYDIAIVAVVDGGSGITVDSPPSRASGITVPDAPVFQNVNTNASAITLTITLDRGSADCFRLEYRPETMLIRNPETIPYEGVPVVYTIDGLASAELHFIEAISKFEDLGSSRSTIEVRTSINGPTNLVVTVITASTLTFTWEAAIEVDDNVIDYVISVSHSGMATTRVGDTDGRTFTIEELPPYTNVEVSVQARRMTEGLEVLSNPLRDTARTMGTLPGPVQNARASQVGKEKRISLEFDIPAMPNGELQQFDVEYIETRQGSEVSTTSNSIPVQSNNIVFYTNSFSANVNRDSSYVFTILAVNNVGRGPSVETNRVFINKTEPNMNGLLQETLLMDEQDSTDQQLSVSFPRALFGDQDSPIEEYTVIIAEDGQRVDDLADLEPLPAYDPDIPGAYQAFSPRPWPTDDQTSVEVVLGEDDVCGSFIYCNPPLQPDTTYLVAIRVYNDAGFITSDFVKIRTPKTFWMENLIYFIIAGAGLLFLLFIAILIACLCTCCRGGDDRRRRSSIRRSHPESKAKNYVDSVSEVSSQSSIGIDNANFNNAAMLMYNPTERSSSRMSVISHISGGAGVVTRPVRIQNFPSHVGKLSANSQEGFQVEFESLHDFGLNQSSAIAVTTDNKSKNRFSNILPYDSSRVVLHGEDDYINASFITGFNRRQEFIATQGPMEHTANDFWRMVWEQQVPIIVMLCDIVEGGKTKCEEYWPTLGEPTAYGEVRLTMLSEKQTTKGTERDFKLEIGEHSRTVAHFQLRGWPDKGVPSETQPFTLFVKDIRAQMDAMSGPVVIHCSDGASRTGVFIALDTLVQALDNKTDSVDIYGVVARLRRERANMVLSKNYYVYLHQAILDILLAEVSDANWSFGATGHGYDQVPLSGGSQLAAESHM